MCMLAISNATPITDTLVDGIRSAIGNAFATAEAIAILVLAGVLSIPIKALGEAAGLATGTIIGVLPTLSILVRLLAFGAVWAVMIAALYSYYGIIVIWAGWFFCVTLLQFAFSRRRRYSTIQAKFLISPLRIAIVVTILGALRPVFSSSFHWLVAYSLAHAFFAYFLNSWERSLIAGNSEKRQTARDTIAKSVIELTLSGQNPPAFALYLRPFGVTNRLGPAAGFPIRDLPFAQSRFMSGRNPFGTDISFSLAMDDAFSDEVESIIANASEASLPLVALGRPGEALGAGRFDASEDAGNDVAWKDIVEKMILDADVIFAIPSARPGTLWEIRHIVSRGHLSKTILLMPFTMRRVRLNLGILRFADNYRREWDAAKEALKDELLLPDYMCKSTLFFYNFGDRVTGIDVDWRKRDAAT